MGALTQSQDFRSHRTAVACGSTLSGRGVRFVRFGFVWFVRFVFSSCRPVLSGVFGRSVLFVCLPQRSCPHLAKPHLANFGVLMFWPNFLLLLLSLFLLLLLFLVVVACCCCCSWLLLLFLVVACCCLLVCVGACWCLLVVLVGGCCLCVWWVCSRFLGLSPGPPSAGPPFWTAQNFALFFLSPATIFILFSLSCWSFALNFGGVFEDRGALMCTFGVGPPGLHTTTRELQTRTFERPGASNTTKIARANPQREKKE